MIISGKFVRIISGDDIKIGTVGIVLHDRVKPVNNIMINFHTHGRTLINKNCLEFITQKEYFIGALGG